jgi:beta-glucosidase
VGSLLQNRSKLGVACVVAALVCLATLVEGQTPTPAVVEKRIDELLGKLTIEEKIDLLGGINRFDIRGVPRLGLPLLHTADGPMGIRNDGPATVMAGGIALAATWNTSLAERVGIELARDARAKGKHFLLGPGVNIYRSPLNGRNFEYFGEDPFLASHMAVSYIEGVQSQHVCATVKHFLGNNSEFARHTSDSIIEERALREIYLPAFEAAVKEAHVCAIMDAYNLTNGVHMTQNGVLNNELVKKEWRFPGLIMSDWNATYDSVEAANGGLDLEMPSGKFLNRDALLPALKAGTVSKATIDDKVRRLLRTEIQFGWLEEATADRSVPRYNLQGRHVALQAAREGMVLLKNEGNLLPLDKTKTRSIAVIGPDGYPAVPVGGGSAQATAFHAVSFLEGLSNYLGSDAIVYSHRGITSLAKAVQNTNFSTKQDGVSPGLQVEIYDNATLAGTPVRTETNQHLSIGKPPDIPTVSAQDFDLSSLVTTSPTSIRWTGYFIPTTSGMHDLFVQEGGSGASGYRLYADGKLVRDSWTMAIAAVQHTELQLDSSPHKIVLEYHIVGGTSGPFVRLGIVRRGEWVDPGAEEMARNTDAVVLAVGFDPGSETEAWDRTFSLPPGQNELIQRIARNNKNTIVLLTSGGGVDMAPWIDLVSGLVETWYPGQEGGTALAEILFGDVNPSGRLPVTFEKRWEDNPSHDHYYPADGTDRVEYKEGVFVGYRGYEQEHIEPQFPFGYGLSYTTFKFSNLVVTPAATLTAQSLSGLAVSFSVSNTGSRAGSVVAQVYVSDEHASVPRPAKELKGFAKVNLKPGETQTVTVPLNSRSLSFYDVKTKQWQAEPGTFKVMVGSSSEQIELSGDIKLNDTISVER